MPAAQPGGSAAVIPRGVWVLGCVSLLMDLSSEMIHSLLPIFMVTGLGASAVTVGVIEGLAEATALIVKIFSGVLSDYLGRRKGLALLGYGMAAITKPLFALATTSGVVLTARVLDRIGKGIRGAPRDALIADMAAPEHRGAIFGLRQSLDTIGAVLGPLIAAGLMWLWHDDFRAIFWVAVIPSFLAVALLYVGVSEERRSGVDARFNPIRRANLVRLPPAYWWVVALGAMMTLARFSEAFLLLRAQHGGMAMAMIPLVLLAMNLFYTASAYPLGKLSDSVSHGKLLALGLLLLVGADLVLAYGDSLACIVGGVLLWGLHMGATQGLLATMVATHAPADLRGTAYGFFNLMSGIAMLLASVTAGVLWDRVGPAATFYAGAAFCLLALAVLSRKPGS